MNLARQPPSFYNGLRAWVPVKRIGPDRYLATIQETYGRRVLSMTVSSPLSNGAVYLNVYSTRIRGSDIHRELSSTHSVRKLKNTNGELSLMIQIEAEVNEYYNHRWWLFREFRA